MVGALAFGGTMAYLTDSETATNTFTVGKVQIDLEEPGYAALAETAKKNLVPNQIVTKDPQVENTGENEALVFLKVEMPKANVIVAKDDGTRLAAADTELFAMLNLNAGEGAEKKWVQLADETDETGANNIHVYAYKERLAKDAKTDKLFDSVQLKNVIEGQVDTNTENIKITAYAIQASEVLEDTTDLTDTLDATNLQKIYNIYGKQNKDQTVPEANDHGAKDLSGTAK